MAATALDLLQRFDAAAGLSAQTANRIAPLDDLAAYELLACEVASWANGGLLADPATAAAVPGLRPHDRGGPALTLLPAAGTGPLEVGDRVLLSDAPAALFGTVCNGGFRGGWTTHHGVVDALHAYLHREDVPAVENGTADGLEQTLRLTALLSAHLAQRRRDLDRDRADLSSVLEILKAISAHRRAHDILYVFVEQIARIVSSDRCSIVRVWEHQPNAYVLVSHEDERLSNRVIDLEKYPELTYCLRHRQRILIDDVLTSPLTKPVAQDLRQVGLRSLVVIPIVSSDPEVGTLLLRTARIGAQFTTDEVNFLEIVAEAAANALERAQLFESIQRANEQLEVLAVTDDLTGLYNARFFRQRLEEERARADRYRLPLSCMMLDVDDFKVVNDTFGHLVGDAVLHGIARRTQQSVRRSDVAARYGGEEIVVILPQTGRDGARAQAERLCREIERQPFRADGHAIHITASIGVALYEPVEATADQPAYDLMREVDRALYAAKSSGKNRVVAAWETT